ncbi:hypothetical protein GCM10009122_29760 [Fulvivirga kasyanovii]
MKNLIALVDTIPSQTKNYHVWFQMESCDTSELVTHIWINEKLGDRTFKDSGVNICKFYPYKKGHVFIYMLQNCSLDIPEYLLKETQLPFKAEDSPFYTSSGMYRSILTRKTGDVIHHYLLIPLNEDEGVEKMLEKFKDIY